MAPKYDFHIHTNISACAGPAMELAALVAECERLGHECIGITDHLNHPDQLGRVASLLEAVRRLETPIEVYFGTESNYVPEVGGHTLTAQMKADCGFQFAIGSHHNLYLPQGAGLEEIVLTQHRYHLLTCQNLAMDILGHPWRYLKGTLELAGWPATDLRRAMPERLLRELGQASRDTGTAVEINAASFLANPPEGNPYRAGYVEFLQVLREEGATFALGSDAHHVHRLADILPAWELADQLGLATRIWRPTSVAASAAGIR